MLGEMRGEKIICSLGNPESGDPDGTGWDLVQKTTGS